MKMRKSKSREVQKLIKKIQELMSKASSPYRNMSEEEAIEKMRQIREKLWEEKFASRP